VLRPADLLAFLTKAAVRVARRPWLPKDRPPVATRLYRQLPRQDLHLQERVTFSRHTLTAGGSAAAGLASGP
jgi:hypothetical protein